MPGVDPRTLGEEAQSFLASYKPPEGLWQERHDAQRKRFAEMERRMFETIDRKLNQTISQACRRPVSAYFVTT
jgi:hypothetical protein